MTGLFRLTKICEGTFAKTMITLAEEGRSGSVVCSFGRLIPEAVIILKDGRPVGAMFGALQGNAVFDLLICQEACLKEISFSPNVSLHDLVNTPLVARVESILQHTNESVNNCAARSFIYGMLPLGWPSLETDESPALLKVLYDFSQHRRFFEGIEPLDHDVVAPIRECVLLRRALSAHAIQYLNALIPLNSLGALFELVHPLDEKETKNLEDYKRSLLPNPIATHIALERFYALASALESIAYRRGPIVGDEARRIIYRIIMSNSKPRDDDDSGSSHSRVPRPSGDPDPLSGTAKAIPPEEEGEFV